MATKRMIDSNLFEDDFVGGLDYFGRYLWIGLFTAVVDDQGRCPDNTAIIRAHVFPFDQVSDEQVEAVLVKMAESGKILRYQAGNKRLIQIVKWWEYQQPSWASESKHPAPDGWMDRVKYHGKGNKIIIENWDAEGGFTSLPSPLHSALPSRLPSGLGRAIKKNENEKKDERRGEEGERREQPAAAAVSPARPLIFSVYEKEVGPLTGMIAEQLKVIEEDYPEGWFEMACKEAAVYNKRNLAYILGILKNWKVSGVGGGRTENGKTTAAAPVKVAKPRYDTSELDQLIAGGA